MRLVLVTQDFPPHRGGIQTYAFELAKRLAVRCEAFAVIAPAEGDTAATDRGLGFRVLRHGTFDMMVAACAPALAKLVLGEGFDHALHAQWTTLPASLALRGLRRLKNVTVAAHGRELLLEPWRASKLAQGSYDAVRRQSLTRADRVLAGSAYTAGLVERLGVARERITVTRYGTDPSRFTPRNATALRARLGLSGRPVLVTIARLVERKGIDSVLEALPAVRRAVPDVAYVVVGEGPHRSELEAAARTAGVDGAVHFVGSVPDDELPLWYSLGDVFVMPSRSEAPDVEGFGIVYLEAGACERPVVALAAGGVPDAVADGISGFLVAPGDRAALAARLSELLLDPARAAELGRRGRERVLGELNWDSVTERTLAALGS
ncbi:MAG TPA: glycosyltransferase family 4 protein [Polyangiaceae bacterium]|nr:glycosyltransferase family 4 protein [Polyangiaceae bacterium]